MTHAFIFSKHPSGPLWHWRCSCGRRLESHMFGVSMTWLPFVEAMEKAEIHLFAVDAEIVDELLQP